MYCSDQCFCSRLKSFVRICSFYVELIGPVLFSGLTLLSHHKIFPRTLLWFPSTIFSDVFFSFTIFSSSVDNMCGSICSSHFLSIKICIVGSTLRVVVFSKI